MKRRSQPLKDAMHLVAYDRSGGVVHEEVLSIHDYYDELHPVIDENVFRKLKGIVRLLGTKYDENGEVEERWENSYDASGAYVNGTVRDKNGNVINEE